MAKNDIDPYYQSGVSTVEHRNLDAAGTDHPFGDEPKQFEADLQPLIREFADDLYDTWEATVREYLANAETATLKVKHYLENPEESPFDEMIVEDSYQPTIEVEWDRSEQKLYIQDNGIGMAAVEVDEVFRQIGRSAARDIGGMSGAFGMGALSFSKFIGEDNIMIMITHSRLNDDNAAYLVTLSGVEPIRGTLGDDEYGTRFSLDQHKQDMDVRAAVEKYAKWMRVPVLYTEYDESGTEVFNEDWGDRKLYDEYDPEEYFDSIEAPGAFVAYMSPSAESRTLLLSMEIERNNSNMYGAPYDFDVRILDESGRVVKSSNGNEGLIPVSRMEYEQMLLDARENHITEDLLSNRDVTAQIYQGREADYVVDESVLEEEEALPRGEYATYKEVDPQTLHRSATEVIIGPHSGRCVVSEDQWNNFPEGRAEQFVPEDELEPFDVDSGTGDLRLPEPTTNRSSLQSNSSFWKYIGNTFLERYDDRIDEYREELRRSDSNVEAIKNLESSQLKFQKEDAI